MSYLGNAPARSFISFERQVFSIVNSQTAYALSHSVANENDIRLVVNNVVQEPGSGKAYTATGTALTLSAALTNGTDEMYCVFLGRATATSAPGAGSIGTAQLADLNVTSGKIANDAVTLAKMASGTDGNIISYDASGNPVAVATGNDGQVLTSAGAGAPPVFETPASAANTPRICVKPSAEQSISASTNTTVVFNTENIDTDNAFANNLFTVPSGAAGNYFASATLITNTAAADSLQRAIIKKNSASSGADTDVGYTNIQMADAYDNTITVSCIVNLDVGDSLRVNYYSYQQTSAIKGNNAYVNGTQFRIFKLI